MNTDEFMKRLTDAINTDTKSSTGEAIKRTMISLTMIEITRDFFFWTSEKHREILDEYLREKYKDATLQ